MRELVCLLEEKSAEEFLRIILPKLFRGADIRFRYIPFEGKQHLQKNMVRKLRLYQNPDAYFLVMRDQDSGDCKKIKAELQKKVNDSGKGKRALIRIACRELEAFFLGDLEAVGQAFDKPGLGRGQQRQKFRNPDNIGSPSQELQRITDTGDKVEDARKIAAYMKLDGGNTSRSFNVLITGLRKANASSAALSRPNP